MKKLFNHRNFDGSSIPHIRNTEFITDFTALPPENCHLTTHIRLQCQY